MVRGKNKQKKQQQKKQYSTQHTPACMNIDTYTCIHAYICHIYNMHGMAQYCYHLYKILYDYSTIYFVYTKFSIIINIISYNTCFGQYIILYIYNTIYLIPIIHNSSHTTPFYHGLFELREDAFLTYFSGIQCL